MPLTHSRKVWLYWVTALVVLAAIWVVFAYVLTPITIEKAYRGESLTIFNRMIRGQSHLPVAEYLARWSRLTTKISCGLAVLWFYALLAVVGLTRERTNNLSESAGKVVMSKRRLLVFYALGAVIFGGSLADIVRDTEHWPFSQYPMDSEVFSSKTFSMLRLYGVVQKSPLVEIQLYNTSFIEPFDNSRLSAGLAHTLQVNRQDEAVADCLARYEALRRAGRHRGPPLVAMRLYMVTWTLDPWVSNIDRPDRKELLAEVAPPREGSH